MFNAFCLPPLFTSTNPIPNIWNSAGPMKGSTFIVNLPICSSNITSEELTSESPQNLITEKFKRKEQVLNTTVLLRKCIDFNSKVLVAEDNALSQMLVVRMLNQLEINCDVVSNGDEALHKIFPNDDGFKKQRTSYSLLCIDLEMPVMSCVSNLANSRSILAQRRTLLL